MRLTWLGHSGFKFEIGDQVLLLDPWLSGNPAFPGERRDEALEGATAILITHGHFDHASDAPTLARELKVPVAGIFDLMSWWESSQGIETIGFNKGGTIRLGDVAVTMVNATHSSSVGGENGPVYAGQCAGFMVEHGGRTVYFSGDTDVMADMEVFEALHHPEVGVLSAGGHFTMDMRRAAWAAKRYFNFRTVVPCHWGTFPLLEQSVEAMREALPGVRVVDATVMEPIEL